MKSKALKSCVLVAAFAGTGAMFGCDAPKVTSIESPAECRGSRERAANTGGAGFPHGMRTAGHPVNDRHCPNDDHVRGRHPPRPPEHPICPLAPAPPQVAFWALCNYSAQDLVEPTLPQVKLDVKVVELAGGAVTILSTQPFSLTVPPLKSRACFIQEFGITAAGVSADAVNQPSLNPADSADFPGSTPMFNQVFQSRSLPGLPGEQKYMLTLPDSTDNHRLQPLAARTRRPCERIASVA